MANKINQFITNRQKSISIIVAFVLVFSVASCSSYPDYEQAFYDNEIYGLWTDTVAHEPAGIIINSLLLRSNGTFLSTNSGFGVYSESQKEGELSYFAEEHGNYVQSARNIYFVSKKSVQWDVAVNQQPVVSDVEKVIFESCTYSIEQDTLRISYITYPADAPELTTRKYIRKK